MRKGMTYIAVLAVCVSLSACSDQPAGPETEAGAPPASAAARQMAFIVHLSGANSSAQGQAIFNVNPNGQSIGYRLIATGIDNVTQAHIHLAPPGANGPVVVWLYPSAPPAAGPSGPINGIFASGTITAANLVGQLAGQPLSVLLSSMQNGQAYVNVHTTDFPAGEIRGQF